MARPRNKDEERRTESVAAALTRAEWQALQTAAKQQKVSAGELVRAGLRSIGALPVQEG